MSITQKIKNWFHPPEALQGSYAEKAINTRDTLKRELNKSNNNSPLSLETRLWTAKLNNDYLRVYAEDMGLDYGRWRQFWDNLMPNVGRQTPKVKDYHKLQLHFTEIGLKELAEQTYPLIDKLAPSPEIATNLKKQSLDLIITFYKRCGLDVDKLIKVDSNGNYQNVSDHGIHAMLDKTIKGLEVPNQTTNNTNTDPNTNTQKGIGKVPILAGIGIAALIIIGLIWRYMLGGHTEPYTADNKQL